MLRLDEAVALALKGVTALPAERVGLDRALGRVLAETAHAPRDLPPWDNSAMDGFALQAADTASGLTQLTVLETILAGGVPRQTVTSGACARIMTGAPLPAGADAVVMVEDTDGGASGVVTVRGVVQPGQHVRYSGEDVRAGEPVLRAGVTLGAAELGMLAAMGFPSVMVRQRPRVAVLSTGDEVVEPGFPLGFGQIWSSNTVALMAMITEAGGEPVHCGVAPDDAAGLQAALARCQNAELILTTGGVSMGEADLMKAALSDGLRFHKVAVQPGKPVALGRLFGKPTFGLPGNPVSCLVTFQQLVRPVIRAMLGLSRPFSPVIEAVLTAPIRKRPGRALLARARLHRGDDGAVHATPARSQSSGAMSGMVEADGLVILPLEAGDAAAGEMVRVQVLRWRFMDRAEPGYWREGAEAEAPYGSSAPSSGEDDACC